MASGGERTFRDRERYPIQRGADEEHEREVRRNEAMYATPSPGSLGRRGDRDDYERMRNVISDLRTCLRKALHLLGQIPRNDLENDVSIQVAQIERQNKEMLDTIKDFLKGSRDVRVVIEEFDHHLSPEHTSVDDEHGCCCG